MLSISLWKEIAIVRKYRAAAITKLWRTVIPALDDGLAVMEQAGKWRGGEEHMKVS